MVSLGTLHSENPRGLLSATTRRSRTRTDVVKGSGALVRELRPLWDLLIFKVSIFLYTVLQFFFFVTQFILFHRDHPTLCDPIKRGVSTLCYLNYFRFQQFTTEPRYILLSTEEFRGR